MKFWVIVSYISFLLPGVAFAFPEAPFNALEVQIHKNQMSLDEQLSDYDFEGIVKLSNCSGSIIRFTGQPDQSQAYVLTNGHCIGNMPGPGEVIVNASSRRSMRVSDRSLSFHGIRANELVYATMTGTDVALYRINETYEDLKQMGVEAFILNPGHPNQDTGIDVVSGYWERGYRCNIKYFVFNLLEGGWTFEDSIRYTDVGCHVIGGTSGSPVIETNTRVVVGINNTGNESGRRCAINNPCEVDEDGQVVVEKGASYGQQTYQIYSCLTPGFEIDLAQEGCSLAKPQ
ncbi:MAG: trypsin-like peptidase domain-containing protein [Bdellovibrionales bacterium]|nr:trypsin-like peptidase domain-containing protein [Bdellovibrionales bacterium]